MTNKWVINASPLILLGKAQQLHWLPNLGEVVIPHSVFEKIKAGRPEDSARRWIEQGDGIKFVQPDAKASNDLIAWDLGHGETAVIAWSTNHPDYEAILDDAAARRCARIFQIQLRGTLSVVALAKRRGYIPKCRPVFEKLVDEGFFVSPELIEQIARSVGE